MLQDIKGCKWPNAANVGMMQKQKHQIYKADTAEKLKTRQTTNEANI